MTTNIIPWTENRSRVLHRVPLTVLLFKDSCDIIFKEEKSKLLFGFGGIFQPIG